MDTLEIVNLILTDLILLTIDLLGKLYFVKLLSQMNALMQVKTSLGTIQ